MNRRRFIPLALFGVTAAFLGAGLTLDPRELPSPLIGKQAPAFELPSLGAPDKRISANAFEGHVSSCGVVGACRVARCTPRPRRRRAPPPRR